MPTTVQQLFMEFGMLEIKKVAWGEKFNENRQGVYVVSLSQEPNKHLGIVCEPVFNLSKIEEWIKRVPDFRVDGNRADLKTVMFRLKNFWLPDESILYIGKAPLRKNGDALSQRVKEYFISKIGCKSPHKGGQWIKTLAMLNALTVYYGICENPKLVESNMLEYFTVNVSRTTLSNLYDKQKALPFANIRHNNGNKMHGFKNQYF